MHVEIHNSFKEAIKLPATSVVVYDAFDNPIAVVVNTDGTNYVAVTATNKNFANVLKCLGIDKTVMVKYLDPTRLKTLVP